MKYDFEINDYIGGWPSGNRMWVREQLFRCKGRPVTVRISSLGGALDHGLDIRSQFVEHGQVTVHLFGLTASAATVIAMGARVVKMSRHAAILIHKCSNWMEEWGQLNADELQGVIERLEAQKRRQEALDVVIAQCYAQRMQRPLSEISDLLKEERWLTADEALRLGLVDELIDDEPERRTQDFFVTAPSDLKALGLPAAPKALAAFTAHDDAPASPWRGIMERLDAIKRGIGEALGLARGGIPGHGGQEGGEDGITNRDNIMKKFFTNVCALLALQEGLDVVDGNISLTEAQVQRIEDHMSSLGDQVKNLKSSAADADARRAAAEQAKEELQKIVDELKRQPGAEPDAHVHDEDGHEDAAFDTTALAGFMAGI